MSKFHMGNQEKEITKQEVILELIKKGKFITLALSDGLHPYIITMSYGYDSSRNSIYMHCSKTGLKMQYIMKNSLTCATVIDDLGYILDDCTQRYRSLVIWGQLSIIDDLHEKKHAFGVLFRHLEGEEEKVSSRMNPDDLAFSEVGILRLDIEQIDAKGNI